MRTSGYDVRWHSTCFSVSRNLPALACVVFPFSLFGSITFWNFAPREQARLIEQMGVYVCTATASVLAYLWLVVILQINSPDVIEVR